MVFISARTQSLPERSVIGRAAQRIIDSKVSTWPGNVFWDAERDRCKCDTGKLWKWLCRILLQEAEMHRVCPVDCYPVPSPPSLLNRAIHICSNEAKMINNLIWAKLHFSKSLLHCRDKAEASSISSDMRNVFPNLPNLHWTSRKLFRIWGRHGVMITLPHFMPHLPVWCSGEPGLIPH